MSAIFCCSGTQGYKNKTISEESKFREFITWVAFPKESKIQTEDLPSTATLAIQVVKQVNYGPLENKRYFIHNSNGSGETAFVEVAEQWLINANFQKLNAYKNYKCATHNRFFEMNVYEKDPINSHHWRANVARPASQIDL
ncbi:hypothetical protein P280DRAFT_536420 [Massarina eburnea CBS 473.64]|uniref:Uncharacterized protein n=1 Tax=Massarina eburnea CBS 473.64 TaxID=1395130 RepID=A0A6A6RJ44_9PLEO|nr:hypothetical protein P280DRAFT_536420 [Massarina eburnea CBS 473.64]